jgi:hypothetical protein
MDLPLPKVQTNLQTNSLVKPHGSSQQTRFWASFTHLPPNASLGLPHPEYFKCYIVHRSEETALLKVSKRF